MQDVNRAICPKKMFPGSPAGIREIFANNVAHFRISTRTPRLDLAEKLVALAINAATMVAKATKNIRLYRPVLAVRCGVEFSVIVQMILDDQIALAGRFLQAGHIDDMNFSPRVLDQSFCLQ